MTLCGVLVFSLCLSCIALVSHAQSANEMTVAKLKELVSLEGAISSSSKEEGEEGEGTPMDSEEAPEGDEGEILSDEEGEEGEDMETGKDGQQQKPQKQGASMDEVVGLVSDLICMLPGKEACAAIGVVLDLYLETRLFSAEQEASIEEGEIVRESKAHHVIKHTAHVMCSLLSRLHAAAYTPNLAPKGAKVGVAGGRDMELPMGLQEGVREWCEKMLVLLQQPEDKRDKECIDWLWEMVVCVCVSASELQASRAMAHLLCHAHSPPQLSAVLSIFIAVQARHFFLARSTIQCALTCIQQSLKDMATSHTSGSKDTPPSSRRDSRLGAKNVNVLSCVDSGRSLLLNFTSNMIRILKDETASETSTSQIQRLFRVTLHEQLLPLTQLLTFALPNATQSNELVLLYDLMRLVVDTPNKRDAKGKANKVAVEVEEEEPRLRPQSLNRMLQALLVHHFSLMKVLACTIAKNGHAHLSLEAALGRSLWLISWCTQTTPPSCTNKSEPAPVSSSARVMAYSVVMETILSKEMSVCFLSADSSHQPFPSPSITAQRGELLVSNLDMGFSRAGGRNISLGRGNPEGKGDQETVSPNCSSHLTSHLTQLLLAIGSSPSSSPPAAAMSWRELGVVLLDAVGPQCVADLKLWPDEETLKYSLERDLAIKHMFDSHPVLWQCLLLLADSTLTADSGPMSGQASNGPPAASESSCSASSALITCAPLVRSLLTVLTQHWQRCCVETTSSFRRELNQSVYIMECMARAKWIGPPLSYAGELFPKLSAHEISLLLLAVNSFLKQNFVAVKAGTSCDIKDPGSCQLIKGILVRNIHNFGHLYARFISCCEPQ